MLRVPLCVASTEHPAARQPLGGEEVHQGPLLRVEPIPHLREQLLRRRVDDRLALCAAVEVASSVCR